MATSKTPRKKVRASDITDTAKMLPRLTLAFFNRPRLTALLWIAITIFGVVSYTTLLKREGFPSIAIPIVIVNGTYGVNDAAKVDQSIAGPVSAIALKQDGAKSVRTSSGSNFFTVTVQYEEDTNANSAKDALEKAVKSEGKLPEGATVNYGAPYFGVTGGSIEKIDATITVYSQNSGISLTQLTEQAEVMAKYLQTHKPSAVDSFSVADPFQEFTNPVTNQSMTVQRSFDRYGVGDDGDNRFYPSVIINVASVKGADVIELDNQLQAALDDLAGRPEASGTRTAISASYAPAIKDQISELQRVLLEGLLAVLIIGSIVIAVRASIITVISMVTVIAAAIGVIYLIGYSLNVITLFALILGLSLIVDDTIIMVEAIDSARRRHKDRRKAVVEATTKISRAMIAATLTAALSFTPLIFVGGVLGGFIRAIPVTIISALLISLLVALIFIPFFARFLLLGKKQMGSKAVSEPAQGIEKRLASGIIRPMLWARHHRGREFAVGLTAVCIGLVFIGAGLFIFQKVAFNIFPPSKDSNQLAVALTFNPDTTVEQAEQIAAEADEITSRALGDNLVYASYYGMGDDRAATLYVELVPYSKRSITAGELVERIEKRFDDFDKAKVTAYQVDVGPPSSDFVINIRASDRPAAERLATDMAAYLQGRELTRLSGEKAKITEASIGNTSVYDRSDNTPIITVNATFDGTDTTTLVGLAQGVVRDHYTDARLSDYGLKASDVTFDLGQESENQDSFKSLVIAFPLVLVAIYILLCIQFRSLFQPLLIFMAIPFSFFGIAAGLYYTDNSFSFFSMLGFFALIGLSIKNTILLTDYANQARRAGMGVVDSAAEALGERFRPLVATSLTAVVSLIPLAITSPFWQSLAVTLIFGLLSSTFLVITVFPYYYLGAEYVRLRITRRGFLGWLVLNSVTIGVMGWLFGPVPAIVTFGVVNACLVLIWVVRSIRRQGALA